MSRISSNHLGIIVAIFVIVLRMILKKGMLYSKNQFAQKKRQRFQWTKNRMRVEKEGTVITGRSMNGMKTCGDSD